MNVLISSLVVALAAADKAGRVVDLIFVLLIGVIAGRIGRNVMRAAGYRAFGATLTGIIGALLGAWLFSPFGPWGALLSSPEDPFAGPLVAAFVGALVLIGIVRAIRRV